jgi:GH25 family lysozyme M1 (1,4-beta-N-acetylmuramidase)
MRRILLLALVCAATLVGCGGHPSSGHPHPQPTTKPSLTFKEPDGLTCTTKDPPQANECVEQVMKAEGLKLTAPLTVPAPDQCVDLSQWQGWYPNLSGLHCVIIQAAFGDVEEPSLHEQIRDAINHGIPYGVYDFGEPGVSGGSELRYIASIAPHAPLGYWFDAEVSGVFWRSCEFTSEAQADGLHIFGVFSYPGGYAAGGGTHCAGYLWVSEWGVGGPSPFGGYPRSSIVLWQYSGHGDRFGVTTDLDVNEGLIELGKPSPPPKPKPKRTRKQLQAYLGEIDRLLGAYSKANRHGHDCAHPPFHHAYSSARFDPACAQWAKEARETVKKLGRR